MFLLSATASAGYVNFCNKYDMSEAKDLAQNSPDRLILTEILECLKAPEYEKANIGYYLATNPNLPTPWYEVLFGYGDEDINEGLASNDNLTEAVLAELLETEEPEILKALSKNPSLTEERLLDAIETSSEEILTALAGNMNISDKIFDILSGKSEPVRKALSENPHLAVEQLENLWDSGGKERLVETALSSANYEILEELSENPHLEIRIEVAKNPSTPVYLLEVLAQDESPKVRKAVLENQNTGSKILNMLSDEGGSERLSSIINVYSDADSYAPGTDAQAKISLNMPKGEFNGEISIMGDESWTNLKDLQGVSGKKDFTLNIPTIDLKAGEYKIIAKAENGPETYTSSREITVQETLKADITLALTNTEFKPGQEITASKVSSVKNTGNLKLSGELLLQLQQYKESWEKMKDIHKSSITIRPGEFETLADKINGLKIPEKGTYRILVSVTQNGETLVGNDGMPLDNSGLFPGIRLKKYAKPETILPGDSTTLEVGIVLDGVDNPKSTIFKITDKAEEQPGNNIVLVIDKSGSMGQKDIKPNRISVAKASAGKFVDMSREKDRIGVVVFFDRITVLQGLTTEKQKLTKVIDNIGHGGGTDIGGGIEAAKNLLKNVGGGTIILLTDGCHTSGRDPISAAKEAASYGIRINTIGIGTEGRDDFCVDTLRRVSQVSGAGDTLTANSNESLGGVYSTLSMGMSQKAGEEIKLAEVLPSIENIGHVPNAEEATEDRVSWILPSISVGERVILKYDLKLRNITGERVLVSNKTTLSYYSPLTDIEETTSIGTFYVNVADLESEKIGIMPTTEEGNKLAKRLQSRHGNSVFLFSNKTIPRTAELLLEASKLNLSRVFVLGDYKESEKISKALSNLITWLGDGNVVTAYDTKDVEEAFEELRVEPRDMFTQFLQLVGIR